MEEIKPEITIPERIVNNSSVQVRIRIKHPMTTDNFLEKMDVFYQGKTALTYKMTPGVSDNPRILFYLKAIETSPVKVVFTSNTGKRFAAEEVLKIQG